MDYSCSSYLSESYQCDKHPTGKKIIGRLKGKDQPATRAENLQRSIELLNVGPCTSFQSIDKKRQNKTMKP